MLPGSALSAKWFGSRTAVRSVEAGIATAVELADDDILKWSNSKPSSGGFTMSTSCPVCDSLFEGDEEESSAKEAAKHLVAESRDDPQHRQWVTRNTDSGTANEIADELA